MPDLLLVALVVFLPAFILVGLAMWAARPMADDRPAPRRSIAEDDARWFKP